jgi:hypothetical protein
MAFDPKDLEALAASLLQKGLPILGGLIGGPAGAIAGNVAGSVVGQIAASLGLPADAPPATITERVTTDSQSSDKLASLEDARKTALAFAQLQVDQNNAELNAPGPSWLRFYYGGWRPAAGWAFGPAIFIYQVAAFAVHLPPLPDTLVNSFLLVWTSIAGLRTYERFTGVALDTLPIDKPRK